MPIKNKEIQFEQPSDILIVVNRYIIAILALIVVAILAFGYFFLLNPKISSINTVKQADTETEANKLQNEKLLARVKELESEFNDIKDNRLENLEKLRKIIPTNPQMAELFVLADSIASEHDFSLASIDISEDSSSSANEESRTSGPDRALAANAQDYENLSSTVVVPKNQDTFAVKSLIVHLSIIRPAQEEENKNQETDVYQDFKNYLDDLEKNLRLMDIVSVSFGELTQANGGGQAGFDLDIITYFRDNG